MIPRNVGEERALPPQSNSVKTFRHGGLRRSHAEASVQEFDNSDELRGSWMLLKGKKILVAGARNHPNCLVLPFSLELIRLAAWACTRD